MPWSAAVPIAVAGLSLAGVAGGLAYAVSAPESQVFGRTLVAPPLPSQVALTFDDGPNPAATPRLLEVLERHKVRATFFLIGDFVRLEPKLTREIVAAGHVVGNHTMHHRFLPKLSSAHVHAELAECNEILEATLGRKPAFFRPPHGGRSPAVFRAAESLRLQTVQWNVIVGDWREGSSATIVRRVEEGVARHRRRRTGTCVVLHDGGQAGLGAPRLHVVEAVEALLGKIGDGTQFVVPGGGGWA